MVEEILVGEDIAAGRNVIEALEKATFPVDAAFWLYESKWERWSLWIASPRVAGGLQKAYLKAGAILDGVTDREVLDLPRITLALPTDRIVEAVKSIIDVKGLANVRLRHTLGDHGIFIEDTLIYRTAA